MLVAGNVKEIAVKQKELAIAIGVTPARVSQLIKDGIVIRDEKNPSGAVLLYESLKNYFQTAVKRTDTGIDINEERAKFERARRVMEEMKVAKAMRKLYDAKTVELVMTEELSTLRTQLLGLPSKFAPILEGKTREEINEIMTREIEGKLAELSEYSPDVFSEEVEDDEGANEDG